jgi:hypothetical protein
MNPSKKCTAIKSLLLLALMWTAALACAAQTGTVMHLSGPLLAKKADGGIRVLAPKSAVEPGDTLITQKNGYAQIRFGDGSLLILQPDTILRIDGFSYDAARPEADRIAFTLVRGGVRSNTGLLGKRSKERVMLNTPVANIDMQGASVIVQYYEKNAEALAARQAYLRASTAALDAPLAATRSDAPPVAAVRPLMLAQLFSPPPTAGRAPGLYVQVLDGLIHVTNPSGSSNFSAGQFGYVRTSMQPPVIVPKNPGIQFTPPPAFNQSTGPGTSTGPAKSNTVDCEVR